MQQVGHSINWREPGRCFLDKEITQAEFRDFCVKGVTPSLEETLQRILKNEESMQMDMLSMQIDMLNEYLTIHPVTGKVYPGRVQKI